MNLLSYECLLWMYAVPSVVYILLSLLLPSPIFLIFKHTLHSSILMGTSVVIVILNAVLILFIGSSLVVLLQ